MNAWASDEISPSLQTLAVGGALALVTAAVIHRHKDKLSSFLVEDFATEDMNQDTDWERLTIPAQVHNIFSISFSLIIECKLILIINFFRNKDVLKHVLLLHLDHDRYSLKENVA